MLTHLTSAVAPDRMGLQAESAQQLLKYQRSIVVNDLKLVCLCC